MSFVLLALRYTRSVVVVKYSVVQHLRLFVFSRFVVHCCDIQRRFGRRNRGITIYF